MDIPKDAASPVLGPKLHAADAATVVRIPQCAPREAQTKTKNASARLPSVLVQGEACMNDAHVCPPLALLNLSKLTRTEG